MESRIFRNLQPHCETDIVDGVQTILISRHGLLRFIEAFEVDIDASPILCGAVDFFRMKDVQAHAHGKNIQLGSFFGHCKR